jgi:hypothetical protein
MEELARLIYERDPTIAHDLTEAINQWDAFLKHQEMSGGFRYDKTLDPDNPVLLEVDRERRERLGRLRDELEYLGPGGEPNA